MGESLHRWPTKAQIQRAIEAHKALGLKVGATETGPGFVRVLTPDQVKAQDPVEAYFAGEAA